MMCNNYKLWYFGDVGTGLMGGSASVLYKDVNTALRGQAQH